MTQVEVAKQADLDAAVADLFVKRATVTLTDAQIKALPTTPVELVATPGAGARIGLLAMYGWLDTTAAKYTNLNATNALGLTTGGGRRISDSHDIHAALNAQGVAGINLVPRMAVLVAEPNGDDGFVAADVEGNLTLTLGNAALGALTGGNAANSLAVVVFYVVVVAP